MAKERVIIVGIGCAFAISPRDAWTYHSSLLEAQPAPARQHWQSICEGSCLVVASSTRTYVRAIYSPADVPSDFCWFRILLRSARFAGYQLESYRFSIQQPQELVPIHPVYGIHDWESPPGCIEWDRMVSFLTKVRASGGEIPPDHHSRDSLNEKKGVPVRAGVIERWTEEFRRIGEEREKGETKIIWVLLDGFLLYWNQVRSHC
jgi:hypothetical protein